VKLHGSHGFHNLVKFEFNCIPRVRDLEQHPSSPRWQGKVKAKKVAKSDAQKEVYEFQKIRWVDNGVH